MAGEIQLNSTTMATESSGTITLSNVNSAINRTNLGLGSIATQAADSVSISGGNITGGTIGSGVVFPAEHVIQTSFFSTTAQPTINTSTFASFSTPFKTTITNTKSSSSFLILVSMSVLTSTSTTSYFHARLNDNTNTAIVGNEGSNGLFGGFFGSGYFDVLQINHSELYSPVSHAGGSLEIEVLVKQNTTLTTYLNTHGLSSSITIMEISG